MAPVVKVIRFTLTAGEGQNADFYRHCIHIYFPAPGLSQPLTGHETVNGLWTPGTAGVWSQ